MRKLENLTASLRWMYNSLFRSSLYIIIQIEVQANNQLALFSLVHSLSIGLQLSESYYCVHPFSRMSFNSRVFR